MVVLLTAHLVVDHLDRCVEPLSETFEKPDDHRREAFPVGVVMESHGIFADFSALEDRRLELGEAQADTAMEVVHVLQELDEGAPGDVQELGIALLSRVKDPVLAKSLENFVGG